MPDQRARDDARDDLLLPSSPNLSGAVSLDIRDQPDDDIITSTGWRRIPFLKTLLWAVLPVAIVTLVNAILFVAIVFSNEQTYDALTFWFRFVDAHLEANISTWVNAGLWLAAGLLAGYIARKAHAHRASWWLFTVACIFFSIDDTALLHERLNDIFADFGESIALSTYAWVIPGAIIAAVIVLLLLRMVLSLPKGSRNGLILGGIVFIIGAIGFDAVGGLLYGEAGYSGMFVVLATVEEACEMTGVALCLASLLHLIQYQRAGGFVAYRVADRASADSRELTTSQA